MRNIESSDWHAEVISHMGDASEVARLILEPLRKTSRSGPISTTPSSIEAISGLSRHTPFITAVVHEKSIPRRLAR